jgi:hypothetical protein
MKQTLPLLLIVFLLNATTARSQEVIDLLNNALQKSAASFQKNKVFLKTDKDCYAPGERIWFKAEVLSPLTKKVSNAHQIIVLIKAESGEIIVDNKYYIENGEVTSQVTVPTWASEGKFFLVAYTLDAYESSEPGLAAIKPININLLKKNDYTLVAELDKQLYKPSDEVKITLQLKPLMPTSKKEKVTVSLYDLHNEVNTLKHSIVVDIPNELRIKLPDKVNDGFYIAIQSDGKANFSKKIPIYTTKDQVNVEFFPEGGTLLSNNAQRIVYRATDLLGEPVDISGSVYDAMGNQVGLGKNLKKGFGMISLMPMPNQKYQFKIESEYGAGQKFELPVAQINGSSFCLVRTENSSLRTTLNNAGNIIGKELTLAIITGTEIVHYVKFTAEAKHNFSFNTADLPTGILQFVVLDNMAHLLSERLIYNLPVNNEELDFNIQPSATTKDELNVSVDLRNFIAAFGSVEVADVKIVDNHVLGQEKIDQHYNFLKYPLLTPVPKTILDNYITNIELIANKNRFFQFGELLNGFETKSPTSNQLSGKVTDKKGNPIENASVMAIIHNQPFSGTMTTNRDGRFLFNELPKCDDVIVKATDKMGKKQYTVTLDKSFDETMEKMLLYELFKWKTESNTSALAEYYETNKDLLKQIGSENKGFKPKTPSNTERLLMSGSTVLDVIKMMKPFTINDNQIVFFGMANSILCQQGALIVIDGQKMGTSITTLEQINPHDVFSINVSTDAVDIQKYTALNSIGVIEITTKGGLDVEKDGKQEQKTVTSFDPALFMANEWKYQTTLLWKPNCKPENDGQLKFSFKPSDIQSDFIIEVDIKTKDGLYIKKTGTFSNQGRATKKDNQQ